MRHNRSYERIAQRHTRLIGLLLVAISVALCFLMVSYFSLRGQRNIPVGIVVASDPVSLLYFDTDRRSTTIIHIPIDTYLKDSSYSLDALWHLGAIDPKDASLLQQSLREAFGAPVIWYIGQKTSAIEPFESVGDYSKQGIVSNIVSPGTFIALLSGTYRTNISPIQFLELFFSTRDIPADRVKTIDIKKTSALVKQQLADGSTVPLLDNDRVDSLFGRVFEDSQIRKESLSVAIYNTTSTPSLGSGVARLLSHVGAVVTVVGNEKGQVDNCIITGSKKSLESLTAVFIQQLYTCNVVIDTQPTRADITMRLGTHFDQK